jgi:phosphatidylserine/phosphatidylglycerophosphate/cardiolipin synthase-like enzyme
MCVLSRQVIEDTAVIGASEPLRLGTKMVVGTAADLCMTGREFLAKRFLIPLAGDAPALLPGRPSLDPADLDTALQHLCHRPPQPAHIGIDVEGEEALRRLEGFIDGAEQSIDVLIYLWDSDALGWGLAQRLADRAAQLGKDGEPPCVRVLIDGGGNMIHGPPESHKAGEVNEVIGWLARQPHLEVLRTRNPLASFDHRKLMIVDGNVAWSGGRNFTLASFFEYHDVSFTMDGPLVGDVLARFEEAWHRAGGQPRSPLDHSPSRKRQRRNSSSGRSGSPRTSNTPNAWGRVVSTGMSRRELAKSLYWAVDHSGHHLYLENPYFTDNLLWCKMARARKRGVDVRVVYARDSQSRLIDRAMRVTANRLMRLGVRVYIYPGTTHVKAASADSRWVYMGTGNFDNLSMRRNKEIGVSISAGPLIDEVEQRVFLPDFRDEWEIKEPLPVQFCDYLAEVVANLVL